MSQTGLRASVNTYAARFRNSVSLAAVANDGMGVPFIPVRNRRYTSCGVAPPRNVHGSVRFVAGSGLPASSFRSVAIAPVPFPSVPWHAAQRSFS
jgi:hypothetical protein